MPRASGEAVRRTAVVGSGVAGLTAAYVLDRAHRVTPYEADDRLGGHAHTHDLTSADGRVDRVDSGFIVHNRRTYPNLRDASLVPTVRPAVRPAVRHSRRENTTRSCPGPS